MAGMPAQPQVHALVELDVRALERARGVLTVLPILLACVRPESRLGPRSFDCGAKYANKRYRLHTSPNNPHSWPWFVETRAQQTPMGGPRFKRNGGTRPGGRTV